MDGEVEDFEAFVAGRWSDLVRSAYLLGCSVPEAEDLVQNVLAQLYSKWARVSEAQNPEAYVYTCMVNAFRRSRRRLWHREIPSDTVPVDGETEPQSEDELDLRRALLAVPLERRAVLVLRYLHDYSEAQVASLLDVPVGTVKSRANRGLKELRAHLSATEPHLAKDQR